MTILTMLVEATVFLVVVLLALSVVGFSVVEMAAPQMRGLQWLLSPVAGLAGLYLACQWLSPWVPSGVIVPVVIVAGFGLDLVVVWRRRPQPRKALALSGFDVVTPGLIGLATYLGLLAHQFKLGLFTVAGTGLDALFVYLPAGEFMRLHAYAAGDPPPVETLAISTFEADFYPGSLGTVDGGLSAVVRRPVYEILEPLNAVCMVLVVVGVYVLVVGALRMSRKAGLLAMVLVATSQFLFWAAGFDFVQQIRASAILPAALALTLFALDQGRLVAAIAAGAMGAALMAIYMPVFLIFAVAAAGAVLATVAAGLVQRRWDSRLRVIGALAAGGVVAGAPSVHWLLFDGGLEAWNLASQDKFGPYAAGGVLATHYSLAELVGTSSLANTYRLKPLLFWSDGWTVLGVVAAAVAVALALFGIVMLVRAGQWLWPAMAGAVMLYIVYVRVVPTNLYGFVKTVSYAVPVTATLIAVGTAFLAGQRLRRGGRLGPAARLPALVAVAAAVLVAGTQLSAAVETEHLFLQLDPTISKAQTNLRALDDVVPERAAVVIRDPGPFIPGTPLTPNTNLAHIAAYFLSGRDVTLATPVSPDPPGDPDYEVTVGNQSASPGYRRVWSDPALAVTLYRRGA